MYIDRQVKNKITCSVAKNNKKLKNSTVIDFILI